MSRLLERLQGLETASTGDHEVLQQLSRDRLLLERRKWLEVLRKSLSNVVRIQSTLSSAAEWQSAEAPEVACPLIHTDFRDEECQTEDQPDHSSPEKEEPAPNCELRSVDNNNNDDINSDDNNHDTYNDDNHAVIFRVRSCPNVHLWQGYESEMCPEAETEKKLEESLDFDLNQLKYCLETDIIDDFVVL